MSEVNDLEIYNEGRRPLEVTLQDGTVETWTVKKVGLDVFDRFARKPATLVERAVAYVEGKNETEVLQLTPESQLDIVRQGGALNRPLFKAFAKEVEAENQAWGKDPDKLTQNALAVALMAQLDPALKKILEAGVPSSPSSSATETPATAS